MRTKQIISGLKNSQRIRAIVNGVGFYTTVQDALAGPFTTQTSAVNVVLHQLGSEKITSLGRSVKVYNSYMEAVVFNIQIDLV
jgi:hypothetical protein